MDPRVDAAIAGPPRFASDYEHNPVVQPHGPSEPANGASALTGLPVDELRKRLAATFPRIEAAKAFLARVGDATARLDERRSKAYAKIDRAEKAVVKAREGGQKLDIVGAILNDQDIGPGPVKKAKAALAEAGAEADSLRQLYDRLDVERTEGQRQLALAEQVRDDAIAQLVDKI